MNGTKVTQYTNPTTGKRGNWSGRYWVTDPLTGARTFHTVRAATRRECETKLREAIRETESGLTVADRKMTIAAFILDRFLPAIRSTVRPNTYRRYSDMLQKRYLLALGSIRLYDLTPLHLQRFYESQLAEGLSPTTVHHMHVIIHRTLKMAVRWGLVHRNVSEMIDPPRRARTEMQTWSAPEAAKVLDAAEGTDLAAFWRIALLCGLRRGELLGLKWQDIDLDRGVLAVRRTLTRNDDNQWVGSEPKTAASRRSIDLPASCVESLRKHRAAQYVQRLSVGPAWIDSGYVFTNALGDPMGPNPVADRFAKLIDTAGVRRIRFHDMRHTCATLHLEGRTQPKVVQELLGHSSISMTMDRYSHVTESMQREAAGTIDRVIATAAQSA